MTRLSRRFLLTGGSAAAFALAFKNVARAASRNPYRDAIVIDGLGGLGNSASEDGPLPDAQVHDARESGLTCVHLTILPVGTTPPDQGLHRRYSASGRWSARSIGIPTRSAEFAQPRTSVLPRRAVVSD